MPPRKMHKKPKLRFAEPRGGAREDDMEDDDDFDMFDGDEEEEEAYRKMMEQEKERRKRNQGDDDSGGLMKLGENMKSAFLGDTNANNNNKKQVLDFSEPKTTNESKEPRAEQQDVTAPSQGWFSGWMGDSTAAAATDAASSSFSGLSMQVKDFVDSNNIIVKVSFFILFLFLFYLLVKILLHVLIYYYSPKAEVKLLDGMMEASGQMIVNQNIASNPWKTIMRSVNQRDGIEFTWSIWVKINRINPGLDYNLLFTKGNRNVSTLTHCRGANVPLNGPGLYLVNDSATHSATLVVFMDTFESPAIYESSSKKRTSCAIADPSIVIPHIPTDAWVHLLVRCVGNTMDVYVNGMIAKTVTFESLPKQNYGDVYVGSNGGFSGNLSNLIYYNRSLTNQEIQSLFSKGPSLKSVDLSTDDLPKSWYNYLSFDWYFR